MKEYLKLQAGEWDADDDDYKMKIKYLSMNL